MSTYLVAGGSRGIGLELDIPGGITQVSLVTDIPGLDASRVGFTADSVSVNLASLTVDPGQFFTVHLPEPGTFASLAAGGVAVAWLSRRRSRSQRAT
mgnify:CR=1 FL=1